MVRWHGLPTLEDFNARSSPSNRPKCIILSSLSDNVFNRVYSCENAKELWKTIIENHKGTEDVANKRYHVLIDKLNSFK